MRYIEEGARIVWSASDLKAAAECEFAWLRAIDAKVGRVPSVVEPEDATLVRAGELGTKHEVATLERYRERFGAGVVEIPATASRDDAGLAAAVAATDAALRSGADVVYQAAFSTDEFVGFADFLVRDESGRWIVQDTKLARRARVTALMQLAAYVDQLDRQGIPRSERVELLLGDGTTSTHRTRDLQPVFELRRSRLRALIADRVVAEAAHAPIAWGDDRGELGVVACGRCATCEEQIVAHRDLLLVAGMRPVQRARLRAQGVTTIDDLAESATPPDKMNPDTFALLRTQARLQLESPAGLPAAAADPHSPPPAPTYEVVLPQALAGMPRPDLGDLFFDFEGDPLYTEGSAAVWGIDYLFGWIDMREEYTALWAHDFAAEKRAFETFLDIVAMRRRQHPGMHIYHYAPYEPTHLLEMAARYGVREGDVDRLLRDGVFVDLYPIVRRALRVGSRSYSIKKLEPLYMGSEVRTSDVQRGDDSIVKYVAARALAEAGDDAGAKEIDADLADYNRYDCVSTRRLRDWLVDRAREAGLRPAGEPEPEERSYEPSFRAVKLGELAASVAAQGREAEAEALRLGAAAIDYYPREAKTFWSRHFLCLREPVSLWEDTRDVVVVDRAASRVTEHWRIPESGRGGERRVVEVHGALAPGTRLTPGGDVFAVYELPAPFPAASNPRAIHAARSARVIEVLDDGAIIEESAVEGVTWGELPIALTPPGPPPAGRQQGAIDEWADAVLDAGGFPADPASDILLRRPPRTTAATLTPAAEGRDISAIVASVLDLDRSHLAVQGPPGTGKTYVGSHVVARLVAEHGFRVGVVAQSHAVVEHMLDRIVAAGLPATQVGKAPKDPDAPVTFTPLTRAGIRGFVEEREAEGFVLGGTAWDFANVDRVRRESLDLLVIDEAGQFSLASTIAVSSAATRLLLLGDPQQLPQVSQGTHPEPIDLSALGWLIGGEAVIPPDRGYFLARSWRMHPAVAGVVSELSYAGRLASHPSAEQRVLADTEPGVFGVPVRHQGDSTSSEAEAAVVVELVRRHLGRTWTDGEHPGRALDEHDVIVVTPYNAQQVVVEEALAAAGFGAVRVGTVDRFQGQEAVIAILSLAASSGRDAPRGLEFLLLPNRLNVAVSRAMHTAFVVYSPGLLDDFPRTPEGVAQLSGFARLVDALPVTEPMALAGG